MNDYEINSVRETFSRLFVLAIRNKMNFDSFTNRLEKSEFVYIIETNKYDSILNKSTNVLFYEITGFEVKEDNSYGVYNDAYWCGQNYFDLHLKTNKSFSYLFLKLPLKQMMNIYTIFHEMDFSSLVDYFYKKCEEKTIIRLLCEKTNNSLADISKDTLIALSTLKKYNTNDKYLYKASFQTVAKLVSYFDVKYSLFKEWYI